jgi:hypothetical protein
MFKGALLVTGLLLLALGAEPLVHAATNQQQRTITCEAFTEAPPRALWLRITGCEMDYLGAGYRESNGRIVELYFPARPAGRPRTDPARIVAATRDASVLALADGTIGGGGTPDQEQFLVMMLKIVTALRAAREIEGYAKASVLDRVSSTNALSALSTPLSPDAVVVDLHAKPRLVIPAAATAAGVLLLGMFVALRSRRRPEASRPLPPDAVEEPVMDDREQPVIPPQPAAEAVTGDAMSVNPEPALAAVTRVRLMLLNLPPDAEQDAIETAPPLSRRADVIDAIAGIVPGLRFDASGSASIGRFDFLLTVNIGPTDPVYTAVIDARGPAALPIVRRILERTGWRAFAARTGVFISPDQLDDHAARASGHTAA